MLSFGGPHGGYDPTGKTVQVSMNTGTNAFPFSASSPDAWLELTSSASSISATPTNVTVKVNAARLPNGIHNGLINFTAVVNGVPVNRSLPVSARVDTHKILSKYPPAEPGALVCEPLEAARSGR